MGLGAEVSCDPWALLPVEGHVRGLGTGPEVTGCRGVTGLALTRPLSSDPGPQGGGDPRPRAGHTGPAPGQGGARGSQGP